MSAWAIRWGAVGAVVWVPRQAEFLVESSDSAGLRLSGDPIELWNARFEDAAPARSFPSFKKQRNFPTWWWPATMDRQIGFESWLERDHLMGGRLGTVCT